MSVSTGPFGYSAVSSASRATSGQTSSGRMAIFFGQSTVSYDAAIQAAVAEAGKDLPDSSTLEWFEVIEFRGAITQDKATQADVAQFQTAIRVGYVSQG